MLNKIMIIGNLGRDPEVKYVPSGKAVCTFSVAVSFKSKDKEETEWFDVESWDRLAETAGQYLQKGRQVYVEGRLKVEKYTGKDGTEKKKVKVVANEIKFLGGKFAENGIMAKQDAQIAEAKEAAGTDDFPF